MYSAIHPDGLVIFSRDHLFNTRPPGNNPNTTWLAGNQSRKAVRGPPGVTVVPVDPWWIRLAETEKPSTAIKDLERGETMVDWIQRVRVKVATNQTTKAFHVTQPITKPAFTTTTTPKPKYNTRLKSPHKYPDDIPEYDENAIIYNYKSYPDIRYPNPSPP